MKKHDKAESGQDLLTRPIMWWKWLISFMATGWLLIFGLNIAIGEPPFEGRPMATSLAAERATISVLSFVIVAGITFWISRQRTKAAQSVENRTVDNLK
jgi:hypothetical protein